MCVHACVVARLIGAWCVCVMCRSTATQTRCSTCRSSSHSASSSAVCFRSSSPGAAPPAFEWNGASRCVAEHGPVVHMNCCFIVHGRAFLECSAPTSSWSRLAEPQYSASETTHIYNLEPSCRTRTSAVRRERAACHLRAGTPLDVMRLVLAIGRTRCARGDPSRVGILGRLLRSALSQATSWPSNRRVTVGQNCTARRKRGEGGTA